MRATPRQGDGALLLDGAPLTASADEINKLEGAGETIASGSAVAHIDAPSGGSTIDAEARSTIESILTALEAFGIQLSE